MIESIDLRVGREGLSNVDTTHSGSTHRSRRTTAIDLRVGREGLSNVDTTHSGFSSPPKSPWRLYWS